MNKRRCRFPFVTKTAALLWKQSERKQTPHLHDDAPALVFCVEASGEEIHKRLQRREGNTEH